MAKSRYDEGKVLRQLDKKSVRIDYALKVIEVAKEANDIGIHSWGKLDFLQNYCGWKIISVNMTEIMQSKIAEREARKAERKREKEERKNKKMFMVNMVKDAIKKPKIKR